MDADRPTEIASGEYLLSVHASIAALIVVSRSLPSFFLFLFFFHSSHFCRVIVVVGVPRKRNVRSEDVIKENPESRGWGTGRTSIECMNMEFMVFAATTINNPTFVSSRLQLPFPIRLT